MTQNQIVMQEKMVSLGRLVAGVVHEINTPMGSIKSMHDTLARAVDKLKETVDTPALDGAEDRKPVDRVLEVITDGIRVISSGEERVTEIVNNLRSFARLDEAEFQMADLHEGIESTLALLQSEMGEDIEVVREYADLDLIYFSPSQLNQVFMSLLRNAIQAIEGEGQIRVNPLVAEDWVF